MPVRSPASLRSCSRQPGYSARPGRRPGSVELVEGASVPPENCRDRGKCGASDTHNLPPGQGRLASPVVLSEQVVGGPLPREPGTAPPNETDRHAEQRVIPRTLRDRWNAPGPEVELLAAEGADGKSRLGCRVNTTADGWPTETAWAAPYVRAGRAAIVTVLVLLFAYVGVRFTVYPRELWLWSALYYATLAALGATMAIFVGIGLVMGVKYWKKRRSGLPVGAIRSKLA